MQGEYLVAHLEAALAADPGVSLLDLKVSVRGGSIHVTGQVDDEATRQAAEAVVRAAAPGYRVFNDITLLDLGPPARPEVIVDQAGGDRGRPLLG
jgi:hypothetical protein